MRAFVDLRVESEDFKGETSVATGAARAPAGCARLTCVAVISTYAHRLVAGHNDRLVVESDFWLNLRLFRGTPWCEPAKFVVAGLSLGACARGSPATSQRARSLARSRRGNLESTARVDPCCIDDPCPGIATVLVADLRRLAVGKRLASSVLGCDPDARSCACRFATSPGEYSEASLKAPLPESTSGFPRVKRRCLAASSAERRLRRQDACSAAADANARRPKTLMASS